MLTGAQAVARIWRHTGDFDIAGLSASLDPNHAYTLAELIHIAERSNPRTLDAESLSRLLGKLPRDFRSAYYPILAGVAIFAGQQTIDPFPKPGRMSQQYTLPRIVITAVLEPSLPVAA